MFYKSILKKLELLEEYFKNYVKDLSNTKNNILCKQDLIYDQVINNNGDIEIVLSKIEDVSQKLNSIYFDNQIIKHQLYLENELKKSIENIDNLSIMIHNTIESINYTIYSIENK